MSSTPPTWVQEIARRKGLMAAVRERARALFEAGAPGLTIATSICEATDQVLLTLIEESCREFSSGPRESLAAQGAVVAVGGTGRGELAPYSDLDLLFLHERSGGREFPEFVSSFVQNCWDSGIKLGHAMRDVASCIDLARENPQIATALVEARYLWGSRNLYERLVAQFRQRVIVARRRQFIDDCLSARSAGWSADGPPAQELEPDIKTSAGGLRDLHLIRWIGYARYGEKDIDALTLKGALKKSDARKLKECWEFLTRLRIDLQLAAGRAQDLLTRDEQLRIAAERGFVDTPEQRAVERFMQEYFYYSSELAAISRRFAALERPRSLFVQFWDLAAGHRADRGLYVGPAQIDVAERNLPKVSHSLETMLAAYNSAAMYNLPLAPRVTEAIKAAVPNVEHVITRESARMFMEILKCTRPLGRNVRSMFDTGLLDVVIPDVTHVRNLLQFNQYHHFTVDEHSLRAVETVTSFEQDTGPVGTAYRAIKHKELLHLAVLLHDLGKGFNRDHCEVGQEIALRIGRRVFLPDDQLEQLALLVLKHLDMADLAFRRDITDEQLLVNFSSEIGSPDTLRMLYVLTAADVMAVGPGTWTNWKASLLAELFDRCLVILSGKGYSFLEAERIRMVKNSVLAEFNRQGGETRTSEWIDDRLRGFSGYYLTTTPPVQIVADLRIIEGLTLTDVQVASKWDDQTHTTEYRIITRNPLATSGCFHKMCGVLTAKRLEILSADINTTSDGVVVDSYRVVDRDYRGQPPPYRCAEVADAFRDVLQGRITVESIFLRNRRFGSDRIERPVSDLKTRVRIDNDSSDARTIIDVFAHDRPGLLYTVARTLFELGLSIDMAKIATHFDQVVDVFYVQETDGRKVQDPQRLREIKDRLQTSLQDFEETGHRQFVSGK